MTLTYTAILTIFSPGLLSGHLKVSIETVGNCCSSIARSPEALFHIQATVSKHWRHEIHIKAKGN